MCKAGSIHTLGDSRMLFRLKVSVLTVVKVHEVACIDSDRSVVCLCVVVCFVVGVGCRSVSSIVPHRLFTESRCALAGEEGRRTDHRRRGEQTPVAGKKCGKKTYDYDRGFCWRAGSSSSAVHQRHNRGKMTASDRRTLSQFEQECVAKTRALISLEGVIGDQVGAFWKKCICGEIRMVSGMTSTTVAHASL